MPNHIMIDIETLSTAPNAIVASIGAKAFDIESLKEDGPEFYIKLNVMQQQKVGCHIDARTFIWWLEQNDEARQAMVEPGENVETSLSKLRAFILEYGGDKPCVWANGSMFDLVILRNLFDSFRVVWPCQYRNEYDFRTVSHYIQQVVPGYELKWEETTKHNALADAANQAQVLQKISLAFQVIATEMKKKAKQEVETQTVEKPKEKKTETKKKKPGPKTKGTISIDEVRKALRLYSQHYSQKDALAILNKYGAKKLLDLKPAKYNQVLKELDITEALEAKE